VTDPDELAVKGRFGKIGAFPVMLRASDWWNFKVPPLLAVAYLLISLLEMPFLPALKMLAGFLIWVVGAAGFGHFLNDCFDIRQDLEAGKPNQAAPLKPWKRILLLAILLAFVGLPWWLSGAGPILHGLVWGHILLFVLYSMPPFRFKERGILGVLADALYAHVFPFLIAAAAFVQLSPVPVAGLQTGFLLLVAWQLLIGIQNILFHQIKDMENDRLAGVQTFATPERILGFHRAIVFMLIPLEWLAFGGLMFLFLPSGWWIAGFAMYFLYGIRRHIYFYGQRLYPFRSSVYSDMGRGAFNGFYEVLWPVFALLLLVTGGIVFAGIAVFHLLIFPSVYRWLKQDWKEFGGMIRTMFLDPFYHKGLKPAAFEGVNYMYHKGVKRVYFWFLDKVIYHGIKPLLYEGVHQGYHRGIKLFYYRYLHKFIWEAKRKLKGKTRKDENGSI
jgi:4-hydroxybenzoate polyprenyltransferase